VYEKHLEDTQAGWLDEAGEPTRKDGVPVESVVGARQVDAAAAAVIARAVKKVRRDAGDPQMAAGRALELLAADYLGGA
jgi:ribose/xylose/arabinose/galactoside ABC-type transport system permease subunit